VVAPRTPLPEYLLKHVGHEVKYLCYAASVHPLLLADDSHSYDVLAQDSACIRARALLDFQRPASRGDAMSVSVLEFYAIRDYKRMPWPRDSQAWFSFISDRIAHLGVDRDGGTENFWPCGEVELRLELLARHVLGLLDKQLPLLRDDCRQVLALVLERATTFLESPDEEGFHAMDPTNLRVALRSPAKD
jgi:hypothetical protein